MKLTIRFFFFFLNDPAPTEIYTLSLHDALPICPTMSRTFSMNSGSVESLKVSARCGCRPKARQMRTTAVCDKPLAFAIVRLLQCVASRGLSRSEEHTSELQSHSDLVCRLLLGKK